MSFYLKDMLVCGKPPLKLTKALVVISEMLHQTWFDMLEGSEISKGSCVLSSLTVRDFLFQAGIHDAVVEPVFTFMEAQQDGVMIHNLGIGKPDEPPSSPTHWAGHMVVVSREAGYLIDTTLYPAQRPQWPDLPNMIAVPLNGDGTVFGEFDALAGLQIPRDETGYSFDIAWLHTPTNVGWKRAPDVGNQRRKRKLVVEKMIAMFKSGSHRQQ
ncbi:hypothetical protein [Rhizobium sp. MHM7A]|uniref:hypothetical protein n=1 Tax=Rhizobium sp. MHM7A TaxID=2583233 RepID=UPI001105C30A|nr:hypothetical protein [Rhizobium sp. MHM7A]TLX15798.1 hypothetical protein FFR93_00335 [Rhizobium sp. MHM7A]